MTNHRNILTAALAAASTLAITAPVASAGTYQLHWCDAEANSLPSPDPAFATVVNATSVGVAQVQPGASTQCSTQFSAQLSMAGAGGWLFGLFHPGASSVLRFTPPSGVTISGIAGYRDTMVGQGSFDAATIWTSTGRALDDVSGTTSGAAQYDRHGQVGFDATALGADGAAGVEWGVKCPAVLPPGETLCVEGHYGLAGSLLLNDATAPTATLNAALAGDHVHVEWAADDPQSGLRQLQVVADGAGQVSEFASCDAKIVHQCGPSRSGSFDVPVSAGQSVTINLTAKNAAYDTQTRSVTVTRPTPPPPPTGGGTTPPTGGTPSGGTSGTTTPPVKTTPVVPNASPAVTLSGKKRAKGKITLSGTASGCTSIILRLPGGRVSYPPVRAGAWSVTVKRRAGTYRALCGAARASRKL